jgi:tRNA pseudouridine55 synthase
VRGILLLDKPVGMSSNAALQQVKRLYQARKAGHSGSLDPLASGMLPITLGEATKMAGFVLEADKQYWARIKLGVTTTTGDAEGEPVRTRPVSPLDEAVLRALLDDFTGPILQVPPMHSAIKRNGQPLYKLAHKGMEVERQPRQVMINHIRVLTHVGDELELEISCSKGTYVRTLAEDIGERLGCGGHVASLRRLTIGPYRGDQMVALESLAAAAETGGLEALDALLLPMESALLHWPSVCLSDEMAFFIRRGQPVVVSKAPKGDMVKLYSARDRFLGIGRVMEDGRIAPRRLVNP